MKGRDDEIETWGDGETAMRGDVEVWKYSPELDACPHVPSPEGEGQEEGMEAARRRGLVVLGTTVCSWRRGRPRCGWCR
jgi:hypothetical protein